MLLHVKALLSAEEIGEVDSILDAARWVSPEGAAAANGSPVKRPEVIDGSASPGVERASELIEEAIRRNAMVQGFALPRTIHDPSFRRHSPGTVPEWQMEPALIGRGPVRNDVALAIFLSDPASYEGGELVIAVAGGTQAFKLPRGDALLYVPTHLHAVAEVRSGQRVAATSSIESHVRESERREMLVQLGEVQGRVAGTGHHPGEALMLLQIHANLLRMWAEV